MRVRWSLGTLAAVVVATIPIFVDASFGRPAAIARGATTLRSGPSVQAAAPGAQSAPTACENTCRAEYDRRISVAAGRLKNRDYSPLNNCPAPWSDKPGVPMACPTAYYACVDQCKDGNCINRCMVALQPCCHANDVENRKHDLGLCLAACPKSKDPAPPTPEQRPAAGGLGKGATLDKTSAWAAMLRSANTALDSLGPDIEALDLERFNNLRRELAFMQVAADLAKSGRKFAAVAGGEGRVWIVLPNGRRVLIGKEPGGLGAASTWDDWIREEQEIRATLGKAGLSKDDVSSMFNMVGQSQRRKEFAPGTVYYFPHDSIRWWQSASSEHSSVRGTINGGGDFI